MKYFKVAANRVVHVANGGVVVIGTIGEPHRYSPSTGLYSRVFTTEVLRYRYSGGRTTEIQREGRQTTAVPTFEIQRIHENSEDGSTMVSDWCATSLQSSDANCGRT